MSARILKGAPVAATMNEKTAQMAEELKARGIVPCLAVVRAGERPDDIAYEKGIIKRCAAVGVELKQVILEDDIAQDELILELCKLNADEAVHGVLIFMPLPEHMDEAAVRAALAPEKDVDGITEGSAATVYCGAGRGFAPCTARAVIEMLKFYDIPMAGRDAAVFGRSLVIGRPAAMLLMQENATVTICHSRSANSAMLARQAEIVVAAVGRAKSLGAEHFVPGQTIIDVGINFDENSKMLGDADFEAALDTVDAITPVPGGVGAVTTAVLVRHTVEAAKKLMTNRQ